MTQDQEVDLTVVDAQEWTETDQKIHQIKKIFQEEGVDNDPDLMDAFDQAIKEAIKN